jgi:hypothetical protein
VRFGGLGECHLTGPTPRVHKPSHTSPSFAQFLPRLL